MLNYSNLQRILVHCWEKPKIWCSVFSSHFDYGGTIFWGEILILTQVIFGDLSSIHAALAGHFARAFTASQNWVPFTPFFLSDYTSPNDRFTRFSNYDFTMVRYYLWIVLDHSSCKFVKKNWQIEYLHLCHQKVPFLQKCRDNLHAIYTFFGQLKQSLNKITMLSCIITVFVKS